MTEEKLLGDRVEQALGIIGVTKDRVEEWTGLPCNCEERKQKLNQLDSWARRVLTGKIEKAKQYLTEILEQPNDNDKELHDADDL